MVERSLSMREVLGSIPGTSTDVFLSEADKISTSPPPLIPKQPTERFTSCKRGRMHFDICPTITLCLLPFEKCSGMPCVHNSILYPLTYTRLFDVFTNKILMIT